MIGIVGEILVDMIGERADGDTRYLVRAGGAPFNVACAAKKMGAEVAFCGSIGKDAMGDFLVSFTKKQGFDPALLQRHDDLNTTLAFVTRDENGERSFSFYRANTADEAFSGELPYPLASADILHLGTLMLSTSRGREYAEKTLKEAKARGQFVSMDVNYRDDIYASPEEALKTYRAFFPFADLLKFSEEEVELFGADDPVFSDSTKAILVTMGAKGAKLSIHGKEIRVPSLSVSPVDTTGAGDAFLGAFLSRIDTKDFFALEEAELREALRFASIVGALNTLSVGAIDGLPTLEEALSRLEDNR